MPFYQASHLAMNIHACWPTYSGPHSSTLAIYSLSSSVIVTVVVEAALIVAWGKPELIPVISTVKSWSPSSSVSGCMVKVEHIAGGGPPTGNTTVAGTGDMKSSGSAAG